MNHEELAKGHVRRGHECGAPELSACGSDPDPVAQDTGNDGSLTDAQGNTDATSMDAKGARDASVDSSVQAALSDGQIVGVLATSDMAEISQGNLAQTQAMDTRVRTFGMDMVNMHSASSARMMILAMSIGAPAMESNLSEMLRAEATATQTRLAGMSGAAFDREYVAAQVMQHARVLDVIDSALIPNATNAQLRTALQSDVRPMVATHLQQPRDLMTALNAM